MNGCTREATAGCRREPRQVRFVEAPELLDHLHPIDSTPTLWLCCHFAAAIEAAAVAVAVASDGSGTFGSSQEAVKPCTLKDEIPSSALLLRASIVAPQQLMLHSGLSHAIRTKLELFRCSMTIAII